MPSVNIAQIVLFRQAIRLPDLDRNIFKRDWSKFKIITHINVPHNAIYQNGRAVA